MSHEPKAYVWLVYTFACALLCIYGELFLVHGLALGLRLLLLVAAAAWVRLGVDPFMPAKATRP